MSLNLSPYLHDRILNESKDTLNEGNVVSNAYVEIYTAPQPVSPVGAPTGTKLATMYLPDPCCTGPTNQFLTILFAGITAVVVADGKASWFRLYNKNGTTMFDGTVVKNGEVGDMQLSDVDLINGKNIQITNAILQFKCP